MVEETEEQLNNWLFSGQATETVLDLPSIRCKEKKRGLAKIGLVAIALATLLWQVPRLDEPESKRPQVRSEQELLDRSVRSQFANSMFRNANVHVLEHVTALIPAGAKVSTEDQSAKPVFDQDDYYLESTAELTEEVNGRVDRPAALFKEPVLIVEGGKYYLAVRDSGNTLYQEASVASVFCLERGRLPTLTTEVLGYDTLTSRLKTDFAQFYRGFPSETHEEEWCHSRIGYDAMENVLNALRPIS